MCVWSADETHDKVGIIIENKKPKLKKLYWMLLSLVLAVPF